MVLAVASDEWKGTGSLENAYPSRDDSLGRDGTAWLALELGYGGRETYLRALAAPKDDPKFIKLQKKLEEKAPGLLVRLRAIAKERRKNEID